MSEWQIKNLGDLLQLIRNGCPSPQVQHVTDYPVTRIETISEAVIDYSKVGYVENLTDKYRLQEGDLLLSNINSIKHIGKVAYYDGSRPLYHGMNLLLLRFVAVYNPKYFFYLLTLNKNWFEKMAAQAINQASINQSTIENCELFIPIDKREQSAIARILSTIDSAIELTEKLIAKQQRIKRGLLQDLLNKGIDEHGTIRSEVTHEFKDSPLGRIPIEWEVRRLESVLEFIDAGKSPLCLSRPAGADEWGILKVSAVRPEGFKSDENKAVKTSHQINVRHEVKQGDLLITRANTYELVGIVCLVDKASQQLLLCDKTLRLNVDKDKAESRFLFHFLQTPIVRSQIEINATGSSGSMKNISQKSIENLEMKLPDLEEQKRIVHILAANAAQTVAYVQQLNKLKGIKKGLMQDLLTGKVKVNSEQTN